jgi:hypothetical protein
MAFVIMLFLASFSLYALGPELIAPINGETCIDKQLLMFMWHEYPNADDYRIEVSTAADFSNLLIDEATNSDTVFTTTILETNTTYYWRVYAVFPPPDNEEVSETWSFITLKDAPAKIQPVDNNSCVGKTYVFKWESITNATYNFQLSRTSNFDNLIEDVSDIDADSITITLPEYNQRYYWRIQAEYDGCITFFSEPDSFTTQRQPATLESPDDNAIAVSRAGVRFTWSAATAPSNYIFQLALDSTFSSVNYEYIGTNTTDSVSRLLYNTMYYWRVRMDYDGCYTEWTPVRSFRTEYEQPQNLVPRNDSICVPLNARLRWDQVFDAVTYHVQISEIMDFSTLLLDSTGIDIYYMHYIFPKGETTYYWRVKAEDANNAGPWSETHALITASTPPERITPLDKTDNLAQTVLFKWNKTNPYSYETVQISDDSSFRRVLIEKKNLTEDSLIVTLPDQFVTYYWRIQTEVDLCVSEWSVPWSFRTVLLPPDLTYPANEATNLNYAITFEWDKAEGALTYDFNLSKSPVFTELVVGRTGIRGEKFYTSGLEPTTEYFWRVKALNDKGESIWSEVSSFTTAAEALDPPKLVSPEDGKDKMPVNKIFLVWNKVDRATKYTIQVADNKNFIRPIINQPDESDSIYTLTSLNYGTKYYWRVMAENDELQSSWSQVWSFETVVQVPTDAPELLQPADNMDPAPTEMTFKWSTVERAENYELEIAYDEQFSNIFLKDTNVFNPKRFVSNIDFEETFFWRVRAKNYSGKGPWSQTRSFTTLVNSINDELAAKFNAGIVPNPVSGVASLALTLENDAFVEVSIYNATGLKMYSYNGQIMSAGMQTFAIDSKELDNGAYFAYIRIDDRTFTLKFVVNK